MKYKLFITDYDGTLGMANDISEENVKAIKEYQSKGGKFVICTGRSYKTILPICKKYGITGDIISFQGALICDIETGVPIYDGGVDKAKILELREKVMNDGLSAGVYIGDYLHYDKINEYMQVYLKVVGFNAIKEDDITETVKNTSEKVRKIIALGKEDIISKAQKKYSEEYADSLIVNTSTPFLFEAINPVNSKGNGVRRIAEYYNIPLSEVITVGDSLNDMELINGEWHGVAVGNAVEELKKKAKEVTVDFKDNPIKILLEKYS